MIDLLIAAGLGALIAHARSQTFEGQMEQLQKDFKSGAISPQQAQTRYQEIAKAESDKIEPMSVVVPKDIRESFENGLHPDNLKGKNVDPNFRNYIEHLHKYGDYNFEKASKNRKH